MKQTVILVRKVNILMVNVFIAAKDEFKNYNNLKKYNTIIKVRKTLKSNANPEVENMHSK